MFKSDLVRAVRAAGRSYAAGALALTVVLATSGCVPLPYKPSATLTHEPVAADAATQVVVAPDTNSVGESVAKSIQKLEPRVVLVDSIEYVAGNLGGSATLADIINTHPGAPPPVIEADYVLCVGKLEYRQLHDTGAAAPYPYFPVIWVGYEKIQSRSALGAWLVDLHDPQAAQYLLTDSTYTEVIAALVYGIGTVPMPDGVIRQKLAREVAHTLAAAHPEGPIRLVVLKELAGPTAIPPPHTLSASAH